jgi:hypothetical protein
MKKLKFLGAFLAAVAVISMMFISSCKKDSTTGDVTPTVNFLAGAGLTSADATIDSGTIVTVSISAFSNTSSNTNLNQVIFTVTFNNSPIITIDSTLKKNVTSFTNNFSFAVNWTGSARVSIKIIDDDNQTKEAYFDIIGKKPTTGTTLTSYASLTMGGSTSAFGSYLDAETGTVYSLTQVNGSTVIKNSIDIIFDNSILNSIAAVITSTGTKFASTTLTASDFNGITTDATFGAYSATLTQITIASGNVVFFQTTGGKKGLVKVISMTSGTGDLNIALKIQP